MFTNRKITAFQHKISDLADVPALTAAELKARFDACPEELRQALNGVCDDGAALEKRMDEYRAQTFAGEITREMLDTEVQAELSAKADQTALDAETAARGALETANNSAHTALRNSISGRCEIATGTFTGTGDTMEISMPFTPAAVVISSESYNTFMVTQGHKSTYNGILIVELKGSTLRVGYTQMLNTAGRLCFYLALR